MNFVFLLTGLAFVFGISWIFSNGRAQVRYKKIAVLFGLQLVISYLCLHTSGGISALTKVSHFFSWLMDHDQNYQWCLFIHSLDADRFYLRLSGDLELFKDLAVYHQMDGLCAK